MLKRLFGISSLALILLTTGCASPKQMAFIDDNETVAEKENPVFLMTAKLSNVHKPSHQPKLLVVHVEKPDAKEAKDRINFTMDDKAKQESAVPSVGNYYYLRMELENGEYILRGMTSLSQAFLINGMFFTPIHENLTANGKGIYYLGHVDATVREREEEEFKAGPSIPLIDQAVVGGSTGTFDIEISDRWQADEEEFRSRFPALADVEVQKAILPPFDRDRAQQWWQDN